MYQTKIVDKVLRQWGLSEDDQSFFLHREALPHIDFGSIIFIETGAGKSYISLMLIKSLFGEPHDKLAELTPDQLKKKRMNQEGSLNYDDNEVGKRKKVVFIVPTNNLVDQ
jgi:replicative superfamily II helicase